jgi:hypothetical protein
MERMVDEGVIIRKSGVLGIEHCVKELSLQAEEETSREETPRTTPLMASI